MTSVQPLALDAAMVDEARAYLRIDSDLPEPSLEAILLAAIRHAESFTGQILIERECRAILSAGSGWQRLSATPVVEIISATGIPAEGARFELDDSAWQHQIDRYGDGLVRIRRPGAAGRAEIIFTAGIAADWAGLPEALRLAVLRLAGYLYVQRDGGDDAGPPAAVAALLRPWRRMRLS